MKRLWAITILNLLVFCGTILLVCSSQAEYSLASKFEPNRIQWNRLVYRAKSSWGKVTNDVQLKYESVNKVAKLLIETPSGRASQTGSSSLLSITTHSTFDPYFGTTELLSSQSWYDPSAVVVLQRSRERRGKDKWHKIYRFTDKGVYRIRKKPKNSKEADLPLELWTKIRGSFYPFEKNYLSCSRVLTPNMLLVLISSIDFQTEDEPVNLCVFNKKQLHNVQIRPAGKKRLKLSYNERSKNREVHRKERVETLKLSFTIRSYGRKNRKPEPFSFLGLNGDFNIYIKKDTKLPVRVSGKVPKVGKVDFQLKEVQLR